MIIKKKKKRERGDLHAQVKPRYIIRTMEETFFVLELKPYHSISSSVVFLLH